MLDVSVLLSRLDQLEVKSEKQEVNVSELEAKVAELEAKVAEQDAKVAEHEVTVVMHEVKINSQQVEIDQLKKKNSNLEAKNHQLILAGAFNEDDVTSRDFLPRSCFELKATNPSAQSGVYSIDPDGQIGADPSIQVYCDMTTRKIIIGYLYGIKKSYINDSLYI